MNEKTIPQRIKELCDKKDTNVSAIERELEFSAGLISRWDKTSPSADRIVSVAKYLETSTDYLLGMTDEDNGKTLADKFIEKLTTDTIDINLHWKQCGNGKTFNNSAMLNVCFEKYGECLNMSDIETYYIMYNGSTIYLYSHLKHIHKEINSFEYLLFVEFEDYDYGDESNYSIISDNEESLSVIYKYIRKYYGNIEVSIKEKSLMESFISRNENKYDTNELISSYYITPQEKEYLHELSKSEIGKRLIPYTTLIKTINDKQK